eukprot:GILK01004457.1.p1 GENE.GILK01004457.1~~GILK01004457.1.p1  ORF type:complete len:721 (-),score=162.74 GILK01004457.1:108-2270(-)
MAAVKKMTIKPFKCPPKLPDKFEENTWEKLQQAVTAVHNKQAVSCSLEELYRAVEDLCLHKMAANLYKRLQVECEKHNEQKVKALTNQTPDYEAFLGLVDATWQDHCSQMLTIRSIFLYLDRTYVLQTVNVRSLWDMGLQLFRQHLSRYADVEKKIITGLLSLIQRERNGEAIDRLLVKSLLRMCSALQIYSDSFEKPFLEETNSFYAAEGVRILQQTDVSEYLKHVENRLAEENERVTSYLDVNTRKPLVTTVEKQLIQSHVSSILDKGFDALMDQTRTADLARMYSLLGRVSAQDDLKSSWHAYVKKTGSSMVTDEERDKNLVKDLLDFKAKLDGILSNAFENNENFQGTLKDAFENFINARQNRPAELIAKFVDEKMKTGNKGSSEEELEQTLDAVMILFRYIQGKDVFEAFYKKDLAKRLLLGKSASFDAEKSMIAKLRTECGSSFTSKLEGMFKDIELSKDIMSTYSQTQKNLSQNIEMSVHVLTAGYWPAYAPMEVKLPAELAVLQETFKTFYLSKHNGRRLMFQPQLGHCLLRAHFAGGRKELSVSLFQAVVLMLFNGSSEIAFRDLKEASGIEDGELRRTLQSLACAQVRVLKKTPMSRDVNDDDMFSFASDFTHKLVRIKINQIQMKETKEENEQTTERVFQDRQYQIDAAIVRIMKTRKTLTHNLLISELFNQLKFPVKPADLKKRIESLIDREYLERDQSNAQSYHYLA